MATRHDCCRRAQDHLASTLRRTRAAGVATAGAAFRTDYTFQDACILNIIRTCDLAIDLANMLIRRRKLGIPTESKESFEILVRHTLIPADLAKRMKAMVGFRNLAVHQYEDIKLEIVESILQRDLNDLLNFAETVRPLLESA